MAAYSKLNVVKDEAFYKAWSLSKTFCQGCGIPAHKASHERWPGLSTHHVVKAGRSHEACNLLRLCQRDHDLAEGKTIKVNGVELPKLSLGICLKLKMLRDPDEVNMDRLQELYGKALPDLGEVPSFLIEEWARWRSEPFFPVELIKPEPPIKLIKPATDGKRCSRCIRLCIDPTRIKCAACEALKQQRKETKK